MIHLQWHLLQHNSTKANEAIRANHVRNGTGQAAKSLFSYNISIRSELESIDWLTEHDTQATHCSSAAVDVMTDVNGVKWN